MGKEYNMQQIERAMGNNPSSAYQQAPGSAHVLNNSTGRDSN